MEIFFTIFVSLLILGIIVIIITLGDPTALIQRKGQGEKIPGLDFIPTQMYRGGADTGGIALNEHTYQICLLNGPATPPRLLEIHDLLGSFLVKNGEIIGQGTRTKPKSIQKLLKMIHTRVQTYLNHTHSRDAGNTCQRIELILALRHQEDPLHVVTLLHMETKEGGILYEKAMNTGKHWHALMDDLILKADHFEHLHEECRKSDSPSAANSADPDLERLSDLAENQLITRQEFEAQKEKLLTSKA